MQSVRYGGGGRLLSPLQLLQWDAGMERVARRAFGGTLIASDDEVAADVVAKYGIHCMCVCRRVLVGV